MKINDLFERGWKFLKYLQSDEKLLLIHDKDTDGSYAAAVASIALKRMGIRVSEVVGAREDVFDALQRCDKAIILDVAASFLYGIEDSRKNVLIIDHHPFEKDLNSEKVVFINPRIFDKEIYQPTTYVTYKFFSQIVDLKDVEWIAVIGTVGDYGFEDCKDILDKYFRVSKKADIWKTKYGKAAIMTSGFAYKYGFENLLGILASAKNFNDLIKNEKIIATYREYLKSFNKAKKEMGKNTEVIGKLMFSVIDTSGFGSALATQSATKNPNKIVIILEKSGQNYKVHGRYQLGKVHIGELLKKLAGGGGHREAGGAVIGSWELEDFKKELIEELKNKL